MEAFKKVDYTVYSAPSYIDKVLNELTDIPVIAYDCETQSIYTKPEKEEAKEFLKEHEDDATRETLSFCKLVSASSGLSYPSLVKVTHFIFGVSNSKSIILIPESKDDEQKIHEWVSNYKGKMLIHNSLFDLKITYLRTGKLPVNFEDTQLLAKCYMNHTENWKSNTGLKELMGKYYDPAWTDIETYDIEDYRDENFLRYCAIDGAATYYLYEQLIEHKESL